MSSLTARVFNIQGYSLQDGPGIRTTVFLKGCPLHCLWCANPESQEMDTDLLHTAQKCVKCYRCVQFCKHGAVSLPANLGDSPVIDHTKCRQCPDIEWCASQCYSQALEVCGKVWNVDDLYDRCMQDETFFDSSGGGVTVSGGEALVHWEFVTELFSQLRESYVSTCIETTLFGPWEHCKSILDETDILLVDVKHMDSEQHKKLIGVGNELILENIERAVNETKCRIVIRIPVIPGANDSNENMEATAEFAKRIGVREVHILAYHRMGMGKYYGLGREYPLGEEVESPSDERMEYIKSIFESKGLSCNIGGHM